MSSDGYRDGEMGNLHQTKFKSNLEAEKYRVDYSYGQNAKLQKEYETRRIEDDERAKRIREDIAATRTTFPSSIGSSSSSIPLWVTQAFWFSLFSTLVMGLPLLNYLGPFSLFFPGAFWFGLFYFFMGRENEVHTVDNKVSDNISIENQKNVQRHLNMIEEMKSDFDRGIKRPAPELNVIKKKLILKSQLVPLIFAGLIVLLLIIVTNLRWFF